MTNDATSAIRWNDTSAGIFLNKRLFVCQAHSGSYKDAAAALIIYQPPPVDVCWPFDGGGPASFSEANVAPQAAPTVPPVWPGSSSAE